MDFQIACWQWLALGMVLIISEMLIPSFTIVRFGLAASENAKPVLLPGDIPTAVRSIMGAVSKQSVLHLDSLRCSASAGPSGPAVLVRSRLA